MRAIALLATHNERRFIEPCLEHLHSQGVDTYLIDNDSTDGTVELAERHLGRGLIGIEEFPHNGVYDWRGLLRRKERLAGELEADWFIHLDADEIRLPPSGYRTLTEALGAVDDAGYNAVNFIEFTFMPTREEPDHDHPDFERTLRTYYPFSPAFPHQLKAWKKTDTVDLASKAGHKVQFPGLKMYPESFPMKHYLFLSVPHAIEKYVGRNFDPGEVESGWHGWRARITADDFRLPSRNELRFAPSDRDLDPGEPRIRHWVDSSLRAKQAGPPPLVRRGSPERAEIALTFDDGPSRWTAEIAAVFEEHGCRATFFLSGPAVETRPEDVAILVAAGHELGNHLWSHTDASTQGSDEIRAELERTAEAIQRAGGGRTDLVRPPYFKGPENVAEAVRGSGVRAIVLRSIAVSDWAAGSAAEIVEPVLAAAGPGDIVCLHDGISSDKRDKDTRDPTAAAVRQLVPALIERGLQPVTVSDLLR